MAKQEKIKQTDYTIGGRDISNTAIPLYQEGLTQLGNYNRNIQNRIDPYMKYIDLAQASQKSDLIKDYQRAMGQQTAQNYAATGGGYSSANQMGYDDLQNYYNDYAARLYTSGIGTAEQMAQNEWSNLYNSLGAYNQAYGLGGNYSNIDQYNDMVDKANSNSWTGVVDKLGTAASAIPVYGWAIGAALKGAAALGKTNASDLAKDLRARATGSKSATTTGEYTNDVSADNIFNQFGEDASNFKYKGSWNRFQKALGMNGGK